MHCFALCICNILLVHQLDIQIGPPAEHKTFPSNLGIGTEVLMLFFLYSFALKLPFSWVLAWRYLVFVGLRVKQDGKVTVPRIIPFLSRTAATPVGAHK